MAENIVCVSCGVQIGEISDGMVRAFDNYNVCERCGAEVCGDHCKEKTDDYWVCESCNAE